jgi:hypothetical protein
MRQSIPQMGETISVAFLVFERCGGSQTVRHMIHLVHADVDTASKKCA